MCHYFLRHKNTSNLRYSHFLKNLNLKCQWFFVFYIASDFSILQKMKWLSTQKKILTYIWSCLHFAPQVSLPFCLIVFTGCHPCFCLLNLTYHTSWSFCWSSQMRSQPLPLLFISVISLLGVLDFLIVLAYFGQYSFNDNCVGRLVHTIFWNVFKIGNSILWVWMHVSSLFKLFPTWQ